MRTGASSTKSRFFNIREDPGSDVKYQIKKSEN